MTRAMQAFADVRTRERWLRWALVRDARIVHEATVPPDRGVTIGVDGDVPSADPRRALAFREGESWTLALAPEWRGRIGAQKLEELDAAPDGQGWRRVRLDANARIELGGGVAILVQLVDRPPRKRAPALPPSVRGGLFARADWWFTAFATGSLVLHFAFVVCVLEADWPIEPALIPDRAVELIFPEQPEPEPEHVPAMAMTTPSETSTDDLEPPSEAPPSPAPRRSRSARPRGEPRPSLDADEAARQAIDAVQLQLGALGQNGHLRQLLAHGASTPDQRSLVALATHGVASNEDPGAIRERPRSGCVECGGHEIGRLAASGHADREMTEGEPLHEVVVPPPEPEGPIIDPPIGFDPRELTLALRMRMPAVRRCYEHELTQGNPDTAGRLTIALTVMPVGSVAHVHATENTTGSDALAACTARSLRRVRVRVGPEEPLEVEYPIVFHRPN